ncbi:MAG TPA: alpha/beta fold hydrolase [Stellaceae bacterium]|nr:alpha/beta fold hydrolase [Stellaceae bacterium]
MATIVLAHGAWSAAWAWKKMRPLMARSGHAFFAPTYTGLGERAHLAHAGIDLDTHVADVLGVLEFEDLRDVVLLGHSYGGMVATGVADRARDRIAQLIYLDAFVPKDGQALFDLVPEAQRQRMKASAAANGGWRVAPNPTPADTSPEDQAWIAGKRLPHPLKCLEMPLRLRHGPLTLPRSYIVATRNTEGPFAPFAAEARRTPGWSCYEIDATHSPNITAPEALMALIDRIVAKR